MIHKTAIVGTNVKLGKNVEIGPYCIIGDGAVIGDNVHFRSHVVTEGRVTIGEGTKIYPFAYTCATFVTWSATRFLQKPA